MSNKTLIDAVEKTLEQQEAALAEAKAVSKGLQDRWMEAEVTVQSLSEEVSRSRAALAALSGEAPAPVEETPQTSDDKPYVDVESMTPEEFEKYNAKQGRRQSQVENNPYADTKCPSCNDKKLYEGMISMKGRPVKVIACGSCRYTRPLV